MGKYLLLLSLFLASSCNELVNEHSPAVRPVVADIGTDYCIVTWNNVGDQYTYDVIVRDAGEDDSSFVGTTIRSYYGLSDTTVTIDSLQPNTSYKVKVRTTGGNRAPNESWPPLRFMTE